MVVSVTRILMRQPFVLVLEDKRLTKEYNEAILYITIRNTINK